MNKRQPKQLSLMDAWSASTKRQKLTSEDALTEDVATLSTSVNFTMDTESQSDYQTNTSEFCEINEINECAKNENGFSSDILNADECDGDDQRQGEGKYCKRNCRFHRVLRNSCQKMCPLEDHACLFAAKFVFQILV
jgi:hypothetical protein